MRRMGGTVASLLLVLLACGSAYAQGQINPRIPPPPPPEEVPAPAPAPPVEAPPPAPPAPPPAPATVELAAGTRIPVVLDTALSTRITKRGDSAVFRTTRSIPIDTLEIPPDTEIVATVIEARKPGGFGKPGTLKIQLTGIRLANGAQQGLVGRLDSPDMKQGKISGDRSASNGVIDLAQWAAMGSLGGWNAAGGKGAGYGAAAGAAIGLIIMMSRRGSDLYLEPGMPFDVVVDRPVTLPGAEVQAAQANHARVNGPASYGSSGSVSQAGSPDDSRVPESRRPVLKRRPRNP